jgi:hypothetical protein
MVSPHLMSATGAEVSTDACSAFPGVMMQKQMMAIIKLADFPQRLAIGLFMVSP